MRMNMSLSTPGWFGKLSCLGDFASRRLPPAWIEGCDHWLCAGLSQSRADLGAAWLEAYLSAPLWRFAWGPQVVDAQAWFGVWMPSCDNVGRYFPLVIAQARDIPPPEAWYQHLGQAALQTLVEGEAGGVAAFEAALQRSPAGDPNPLAADSAMVMAVAMAMVPGTSQWCSWLPAEPTGPMHCVTGLPRAEQFSAMLDGRWA
jgi:type VI secretion system protein ImpM